MKLLIFTPAIKTSAIGRSSALVTRELLSQGHTVTIIRTESESLLNSDTHDFQTVMISWEKTQDVILAIEAADVLVYQIGDNYEFHQGGLAWLIKKSGIVILHDFFLGNLFWGWANAHGFNQAVGILHAWYGEKIASNYFNHQNVESLIEGTKNTAPMLEWVCSMADAVITHSSWGCSRVLGSCAGPVRVVPLAYDNLVVAAHPVLSSRGKVREIQENLDPAADKFTILTIGYANFNKRIESVIKAIGVSSLLRSRVTYRLVGFIEPHVKASLSMLAKEKGVDLVISGEVDNQVLAEAVQDCDVISCLRWPCLEAASASLIEALLAGKPTIVTDAGFYSEIPSSCTKKIKHENEIIDIQLALELLFGDPVKREAMAIEGKNWAKAMFTAENYVQNLLDMALDVAKVAPILDAVNNICGLLYNWTNCSDSLDMSEMLKPLKIFENIARKIDN